jgi:hypothetical protein
MAKMARERKVQEKRALKREKKAAAAAARNAQALDGAPPEVPVDDEGSEPAQA